MWLLTLIVCLFCRIGEAANPGPEISEDLNFDLNIGTFNSSGLANKATSVVSLPPGIWAAAETQSTMTTFQTFRKDLLFQAKAQNRRVRAIHGEYAALRPHSTTCGTWSGVAFISDVSTRPIRLPWDLQYNSGRALCAHFAVGELALMGAVIYLPPSEPTFGNTKALAEEFLSSLTAEIIHGSHGLRFISGDFNRGPYDLHTFQQWRDAGWEEIQNIALRRFQRALTPTSKAAAYSDQIWVSPELARYLTDVQTLEETFSEHDPLFATFRLPGGPLHQWHWPAPASLPWDKIGEDLSLKVDFESSAFWQNSTHAFASWSSKVEQSIVRHCELQGVDLPRGVHGRGQTTAPYKRPISLTPLPSSRHGEETASSDLLNRSIHQWFKQLRRLQAYVQRGKTQVLSPGAMADQLHTWLRVLQAPGFRKGFQHWWPTRALKLHGSPDSIPLQPPSQPVAQAIFADFRANFRRYERWQLSRRKSLLQAHAQDHCRPLYRQLKNIDASPPEWFALHYETMIATTHAGCEVELADELTLPSTASWLLQGQQVTLEQLTPTRVLIHTDLILAPGQTLRGVLRVSDFASMEAALAKVWTPIWTRHQDAAEDMWQRAIGFAQAYLPSFPFESCIWTGKHFGNLAKGYKKHTSTGPDGWSRLDLAHLPEAQHDQIATLLDLTQQGLPWPDQLLTGFVCPVKKTVLAERPSEYRPIILLSLIYRLWGCGTTRSLMPGFAALAGPHVYGFVPGQRATDLWFLVQSYVEVALAGHGEFGGFNLDLTKCFNRLPRKPLLFGLARLGIPQPILLAWEQALSALQRRFRIGQDIGPSHRSVTGIPEGDPMSIVGMLCFNILMDKYFTIYGGGCLLTSFVDNLQVLADSPGQLQQGRLLAQTFLEALDLDLDPVKSYGWGTTPHYRKALRALGIPVKLAERDLGAQMTFSKVKWTQSGTARILSISHIWPILRRSPVHPWYKIRAIISAAWPKALHGCENRPVAPTYLAKLRTQAVNSLGWRRAGCSPLVRWSLQQQPEADPEFYEAWNILRTFLRMILLYSNLRESWASFITAPSSNGQGPFHALLSVMRLLGWNWRADLTLDVGYMQIALHEIHHGLLYKLALRDWDRHVAQTLAQRKDFSDLQTIDRKISFQRTDLSIVDQGLLSTLQDGTFYTSWQIAKFDNSRLAFCDLCHSEDDLEHRCVQCPKYAQIRQMHRAVVEKWDSSTPSLTLHGLAPENPHLLQWWQYLQQIPPGLDDFGYIEQQDQLDFFTDGSCFDPTSSFAHAAWAVVTLDPCVVVASSCLRGVIQSINRAELSATLAAVTWKLTHPCRLRIWVDSQYVVNGFQRLLKYQTVPKEWDNQDLWHSALALTFLIDWTSCDILKVQAHCSPADSTSPFEDWLMRGNDFADQAARRQNSMRPSSAMDLLAEMRAAHLHIQRRVRAQQDFLLAISRFDLQRLPLVSEPDPEELTLDQLGGQMMINDCFVAACLEVCYDERIGPVFPFVGSFLFDLASWLIGIDISAPYKQLVSLAELVIGFEHEFRTFPVWIPRDGRHVASYDPGSKLGALIRPTMSGSISLLKQAVEVLFDFAGATIPLEKATRPCLGANCPIWCLRIGLPVELSTAIVGEFVRNFPNGVRHPRDLARSYNLL